MDDRSDKTFSCASMISLVETWTKPTDSLEIEGFKIIHRRDCFDKRKPLGQITYLKKNLNNKDDDLPKIKTVKIEDSHKNNLIQLADMVCGAVARSYSEKSDRNIYREILKKKERSVQFWPK